MAVVFEALDRANGEKIALKSLVQVEDEAKHARHLELFEREFHSLAELAHPRVVEVHAFGRDGETAFYTMELLDGGDLHSLAPLPWRQACAVARDLCSALSFVHSRRLVHRDVSPRNVRCTASGVAKLIDFGAISPLGPNKLLVGTPPCCAPESVNLQSLDARTDLYALGASLYYALTGQHAYPARSMQQLPDAWNTSIVPPARLVPDIPAALDHLVQDLLRLDPDARPASAWEVAQRLAAIDGVPFDSSLPLAHAYLATPTLLGRDEQLTRITRRLKRLAAGSGSSLLITGPSGIGRSRLLDAALLRASLLGFTTMRANGDEASADYAVARSLMRQMMRIDPDAALSAAAPNRELLSHMLPELAAANTQTLAEPMDERLLRPRLQRALLEWCQALASKRPLVVGVDDFERLDEPSAALLSVLASEIAAHPIALVVTASTEAQARGMEATALLRAVSASIELGQLRPEQTEQLFAELFGEQPTLSLLAHRAHALAGGNPRDLLRIAQHLLDRGVIQFEAGSFAVPALDAIELPSSMTAALEARLASLSARALDLACALAVVPDRSFNFSECVALADATPGAARVDLDALIQAEVVRRVEDDYGLAQSGFGALLTAAVESSVQRQLRVRLAGIFARRGDAFREAQQWFAAGEPARALDLLVDFVRRDMEWLSKNPNQVRFAQLRAPAVGWRETYTEALAACHVLGRPRRDRLALLLRVVGLGALLGTYERECLGELLDILLRDSGLGEWIALGDDHDPGTRIATAFQNTQKRFDSLPEGERCENPIQSLHALARNIGAAMAVIPVGHDVAFLRELPDLAPFAPLSPALGAFAQLRAGMLARLTGRSLEAHDIYTALLARVRQPDRSGLQPLNAEYVELGVINALGLLETARGSSGCLRWAEQIEPHPAFEGHAVILRRLHALAHADAETSDQLLARLQRLRIQGGSRQMLESSHLLAEAEAHARADDLTRLRRVADEIARLAERYSGWRPVLAFARAEQHRIRRAAVQALRAVEAGLELVAAGEHQAWAPLAGNHLLVLADLGRFSEGAELGERYLAQAQLRLGFQPAQLSLANALVRAQAGMQDADALAQATLAALIEQGITGTHLGFAHEVCARIALTRQDADAFASHLAACRTIYCAHRHPALVAKIERLRQQLVAGKNSAASLFGPPNVPSVPRIIGALERCAESEQSARLALTFIAHHAGATDAFLFDIAGRALQYATQVGDGIVTGELMRTAQAFLDQQLMEADTTASDAHEIAALTVGASGSEVSAPIYTPLVLNHREGSMTVITGLVLLARPSHLHPGHIIQLISEISRHRAQRGCQGIPLTE